MNDLTTSQVSRRNILNNQYAINEIEKQLNIKSAMYENEYIFTIDQVAKYFEVEKRTVERCIEKNKDELIQNGYQVLRGEALKKLKNSLKNDFATDINVGSKVQVLAICNTKTLLNIAMLLSESQVAKDLRSVMLDIVIDTINKKAGGNTKYINQRDEDFLNSWFAEEQYRKEFTEALKNYVDMGNIKYAIYTNKIYENIFIEKAKEYKQILNLNKNDKIRDTFYSEILDLVSSYETGIAYELKLKYEEKGRKLSNLEVNEVFENFHSHPSRKPLLNKARNKMASRDLVFRDALHLQLEEYITPLQKEDFEKFIGEKSKDLQARLEEAKDVFKRLKDY